MRRYFFAVFLLFYIALPLLSQEIESFIEKKCLNGIEIPDKLMPAFQTYRSKESFSHCLGSDSCGISGYALIQRLKNSVKYDATVHCPLCEVDFPVSSASLQIMNPQTRTNKDYVIALDGMPLNADWQAPPECPLCGGSYDILSLNRLLCSNLWEMWRIQHYDASGWSGYIEPLLLSEVDKYLVYQASVKASRALRENPEKRKYFLEVALESLDQHISDSKIKHNLDDKDESAYSDWNLLQSDIMKMKAELLRQMSRFGEAAALLDEFEIKYSADYDSAKIRKLINQKNCEPAAKPIGNDLHEAVLRAKAGEPVKDTDEIAMLVAADNSLLFQRMHDLTPLMLAICEDKPEVVKFLVGAAYDTIFEKNRGKSIAAHYAALFGNVEILKEVVRFDNINYQNNAGCSPLYVAIEAGNYDAVDYLLSENAAMDLLTDTQKDALVLACTYSTKEHERILERLLKQQTNNRQKFINEAYAAAKESGTPKMQEILKKLGAIEPPPYEENDE